MEKAQIHILDKEMNVTQKGYFDVMFNPTEYSTKISANWTKEDNSENFSYGGSNYESFSLSLLFDSYETKEDVRKEYTSRGKKNLGTDALVELCGTPQVENTSTKEPAPILFSWGTFGFSGYLESVEQKFTMFLEDGTPVRANVTISITPFKDARDALKSMGIDACRKARTIKGSTRLDNLAAKELKDPGKWREIAIENGIDSPWLFPDNDDVGNLLIIPDV